jgi:GDPmannose 4,6-dehydratase
VARIKVGLQDTMYLGNLDAKRDWGHAEDYVEGMWRMLQQDEPGDYVLATGQATSVREFCETAFRAAGIELAWEGEGTEEKGYRTDTGACVIEIDPRYYRPTEVDFLLGDAAKAREALGWTPTHTLDTMIEDMIAADLKEAREEQLIETNGH